MPKAKKNIDPCIICLNHCRTSYKPLLNCECRYTIHKTCFMRWWKDHNNCIICLKYTNLKMKNANTYRRRLNNNIEFERLTPLRGGALYRLRRRGGRYWAQPSWEWDDDEFDLPNVNAACKSLFSAVLMPLVVLGVFILLKF